MSLPMRERGNAWPGLGLMLALLPALVGCCMSYAGNAVPAHRMPPELLCRQRSHMTPIDFSLLRLQPPPTYVIGPRDILGVYIQDVVPSTQNKQEPNILNLPVATQQDYYPPRGFVNAPAVGLPMEVSAEGNLTLPLIQPIHVAGLTFQQAVEKIRRAYSEEAQILEPGRERIMLSLIRPRVQRVMVLRDDISTPPVFQPQGSAALLTRRGTASVLDLPAYENDVLHALAASGGLPGVDAYSAVWIYRARLPEAAAIDRLKGRLDSGESLDTLIKDLKVEHSAIRIPLRVCPGEPTTFAETDITLATGDVVYLETRQAEYFFSGGLLPAGQIPLPRDYDLDVLGALALATGSAGGPPGGPISASFNYKGQYNPGNVVPPTRVLILRKLPNGEQVQIRVDLKKTKYDTRERIIIAPGDFVMLYYKPGEVAENYLFNLATFNVAAIVAASR